MKDKDIIAPIANNEVANSLHTGEQSDIEGWGWLPVLSLVGAVGLLLVALANNGAWNSLAWAKPLFWVGLLLFFGPIAIRLILTYVPRKERIGLIVMLGLWLYLVKLFRSPIAFTFHDELLHWRTVNDIVLSGRLFHMNPLIPASPLYPGLEVITSALISLSGMDIFNAGIVLTCIGRLVFVLALYLLYEEISRSARVAGIASLLYMTEPTFVFFDAQFAYESLALPIAALTLFAIVRRARTPCANDRLSLSLVALFGIGASVCTHHLTTYALLMFLVLWTMTPTLYSWASVFISWYAGEKATQEMVQNILGHLTSLGRRLISHTSQGKKQGLGVITLLALVVSLAWLIYVSSITAKYLASALQDGVSNLIRVIAGEVPRRQLFLSGGQSAPLFEQLVAYASVALILLGLPFGLLQIWRRHRDNAIALSLAGVVLLYPLSMAFRLTDWGMQLSSRASPFIFVAIAYVLAIGVEELFLSRLTTPGRAVAFTTWAAVIFMGGFVLGYPFWSYLPGPYLVSADMRSVEPQGVAAAKWAPVFLGPGNRIIADRINRLLMGAYGQQDLVTFDRDGVNVPFVFFSTEIGSTEKAILEQGNIRYLVVDLRLSSGLPMVGTYFDDGETGAYRHKTPIDPAALAKFDGLENVSRLFDSGDIVIYDVGRLSNAP